MKRQSYLLTRARSTDSRGVMLEKQRRPALVAVVEDDAASRGALGRLLQAGGFEPALFDSAEAFIESPPNRALLCVILDVHLTGISGIDLQQRLRSAAPEVPIIVTTGDRRSASRERARQLGCTAFLSKPFSAETVLGVLTSLPR